MTPEQRWQDACRNVRTNPTPEAEAAELAAYDAVIDRRNAAAYDLNPWEWQPVAVTILAGFGGAVLLALFGGA